MVEYIASNLINQDVLPKNIKISTISATCFLGVNLNLPDIYKYIKLDKNKIITIKYKTFVKSLEVQKKRKKKKNCFQNQMTVEIKPDLKDYPNSKVSVKIFKNGSIQMSGIKSVEAVNTVLNKLIKELSKQLGVIEDNAIKEINFIENNEKIEVSKFKIDMINCGFLCGYEINRENLYNRLLKHNVECKYEPSIHAGVNIKYHPSDNEKKVSVFIFESGNIIITGAKNVINIMEAYNFVTDFLSLNKKDIERNKVYNILKDNINNELKEMLQINEDEDDLMSIAISNNSNSSYLLNNTI
tara:strand:- start:818 stop:1714 length:897 start_codon:yes stop_codon:yes gene_type:complete